MQYCTRASLKRRSTSCTKGIAGSEPGAEPPPVLETSNSRIHTMFVGQTVCAAYGIRLDGHVKQESRRATPESSKQTWRRNIAKTRRKSTPTMDLHRRTSEASLALVWSGYGGGMVVLPCGSCNYLVLLSLQRKCCTVQRWPFDHLSALLILPNEKTAPEVPLSAAELHLGHQAKARNRTHAKSFRLSRARAKFKLPRMKPAPVEPVLAAIPSPAPQGSAAGDLPAPPSSALARLSSLDAFRGLVILTMTLVNYLAGVKNIPAWAKHMPESKDGYTFVDVVFPGFLFLVGVGRVSCLRHPH